MRTGCFFAIVIMSVTGMPGCAATEQAARSPYAGQEKLEIKSLSPDDIEELRQGKGWGLARAAELNGVPGPKHLLEMAEDINLRPSQRTEIEFLYENMRKQAVPLGLELIERERALNRAFAEMTVTERGLRDLLRSAAETRMELRFVHLSTHLKALPLLTGEQVVRYNRLRGYSSGSAPDGPPPAHDPVLWKRHHGGP